VVPGPSPPHDVPADAIVAGVPARLIRMSGFEASTS
jgi:acetyltransferase-like isoleucine patch superfamily enzyme